MWCWGSSRYGQIGSFTDGKVAHAVHLLQNDRQSLSPTPFCHWTNKTALCQPVPTLMKGVGGSRVVAIAAGLRHSALLTGTWSV